VPRALTTFSTILIAGLVAGTPVPSFGQPVATRLATLLVEQGPAPQGYVRDVAAAEATFNTVAGLFQVELSTLPLSASAGGFVYRLNPELGLVERASESFGPFFTERALRVGPKQFALGLVWQSASFSTLQGADLESGTFPTNAARVAGAIDPFSVDTLSLELDTRTVTALATYGLTSRLDVGVAVPFSTVRYSGRRVNTFNGQTSFQMSSAGSATGLGDMVVTARYDLGAGRSHRIAVGSDLRLPTGAEEDLLGAQDAAVRALVIGSWEAGRLAAHLNGGIGVGGASSEWFWSGAATWAIVPRLTLVGELMGRHLDQLHRLRDVYQPHPVLAGIETMRWLPEDGGVQTAYTAVGLKWNVGGNMLLNTSLLVRLTDVGLRARVAPTVSVDYTFAR
jgi:hypothetical protein